MKRFGYDSSGKNTILIAVLELRHERMDHRKRKWIDSNNWHEGGVNEFLEFAFRNKDEKVPCPCKKCVHRFHRSKKEIFDHLVEHRMIEDYDTWYCHRESLHASGVATTLNRNQTVYDDDLDDDDDDDDDDDVVMDLLEHMAHINRITHRRCPTPCDKEQMHSEGFSIMGKRKRSRIVYIATQNERTSNAASASASTAEMEQNVTTQSGAQLGPSNGSPISNHELSEVKFIIPYRVAESYVLKSMGRKWSNFKADLKLEHYEPTVEIAYVYIDTHKDRKTRPAPMDEKSKQAVVSD
ncbi:hypothetical protein Cgig2_011966 [Carnegiea gigantea]|uniref:Transposase-associated domain-containing protein n=1 Tax=Carnegiea gigantea TaxID=171969 RepID=A0A9Q1GMC4_9CARY|nr:hypothetical protein Cgig2_011966 [Carnegiea gigantea]